MILLVLMVFLTDHTFKATITLAPDGTTQAACEVRGKAIAEGLLKDPLVADAQFSCLPAVLRQHS